MRDREPPTSLLLQHGSCCFMSAGRPTPSNHGLTTMLLEGSSLPISDRTSDGDMALLRPWQVTVVLLSPCEYLLLGAALLGQLNMEFGGHLPQPNSDPMIISHEL